MQSAMDHDLDGRSLKRIKATAAAVGKIVMVHGHDLAEKYNADVEIRGAHEAAQQVVCDL